MKTRAIIVLLLLIFLTSSTTYANTINQETPPPGIKILYPATPKNWHLEIKRYNNAVQLNYFDRYDKCIVMIYERSAEGARPLPHTPNTKIVKIKGIEYHATKSADTPTGGVVWWMRKNTYFELFSLYLNQEEMIALAQTIK